MDNRRVTGLVLILSVIFHTQTQIDKQLLTIPFFRMLNRQAEQIKNECVVSQGTRNITERKESDWLLMIYMAADNNLNYFAWHNIKQMAATGSNSNITIVIQLNEPGANKKTQRYLIEQNKAVLLNEDQVAAGKKFNTGDPQTLIDFCSEVTTKFPANHIALVLWDHGTGYLDPFKVKAINPHELFQLNPSDMMLELNRTETDLINQLDTPIGYLRGICFDETYHSYLSNQKVDYALKTICQKLNRKFDIIGLDACLMQMLEFGCLLQPYANYMVGSQEVELGAGWNYKYILAPFAEKTYTAHDLAGHIVSCYQKMYSRITHDYTLSAVNLTGLPALANNANTISTLIQQCIKLQQNNSVKQTLTLCRARKNCTCFDEISYLDLGHLYKNILADLKNFKLQNNQLILDQLKQELENGLRLLNAIVEANVTGKNLTNACGLSIYFPEKNMHTSYPNTPFAASNNWVNLIQDFIH